MTTVCGLDINKQPSWMMPDYVAFPTRVLFDLAGAGATPGRTRPFRARLRRMYREKLVMTDNCL